LSNKALLILALCCNVLITGAIFIGNTALGWSEYSYDFALATEQPVTQSFLRYLEINWITSPWTNFLNDMPLTLFFTFGNMLIGMLLGRIDFFRLPEKLKTLTNWLIGLGLTAGFASSYVLHLVFTGAMELDIPQLWIPFAILAGMLLQSMSYISIFLRLYQFGRVKKLIGFFNPVGKTALTNYLMQSVFYLLIFFHCLPGLHLYGKITAGETYIIALALFGLQSLISTLWLRKFDQGPVEYLWKKLSYRNFHQLKLNQKAKKTEVNAALTIMLILLGGFYAQAQDRIASKVMFQSGEETIEGILVRPNMKDNTPAVVFQQGSGPHAFEGYENKAWGPHKYYIEDVLLELGYAVLYCNKRGLGNSTGNWRRNDFYGRARDAYAGVQYLKSLPFIDPDKIGVSGHSQGGWIAQIAASQHSDIAFVLCLAGPTTGVQTQVDDNDRARFICEGYTGDNLDKKVEKRKRSLAKSANLGKNSGLIGSAKHWYLIHDYTNEEELKALTCPTLFLFGEFDINVDPEININHLNTLFDHEIPKNISYKIMPKGNHGFYQVENKCVDWDTAAKGSFDPEFQNVIRQWLTAL
jgi:pimeloyl-ACP methyl ester carboxylesterase